MKVSSQYMYLSTCTIRWSSFLFWVSEDTFFGNIDLKWPQICPQRAPLPPSCLPAYLFQLLSHCIFVVCTTATVSVLLFYSVISPLFKQKWVYSRYIFYVCIYNRLESIKSQSLLTAGAKKGPKHDPYPLRMREKKLQPEKCQMVWRVFHFYVLHFVCIVSLWYIMPHLIYSQICKSKFICDSFSFFVKPTFKTKKCAWHVKNCLKGFLSDFVILNQNF